MTDSERISRETLLKRAAAVAGAAYVAPVLTSSASAEADACTGQKCPAGKKGKKKCKKKGGKTCKCLNGACSTGGGNCNDCDGDAIPCSAVFLCQTGNCACFLNIPGRGPGHGCIDLLDGLCASFPVCDRAGNGSECPAGTCCLDTCCPSGICGTPCPGIAGTRTPRISGQGATLYRA